MRMIAAMVLLAAAVAGCTADPTTAPSARDDVEFRNAAGERRWCPSPYSGAGWTGIVGSQTQVRQASSCAESARAAGFTATASR